MNGENAFSCGWCTSVKVSRPGHLLLDIKSVTLQGLLAGEPIVDLPEICMFLTQVEVPSTALDSLGHHHGAQPSGLSASLKRKR
jgi:hypothetical protein